MLCNKLPLGSAEGGIVLGLLTPSLVGASIGINIGGGGGGNGADDGSAGNGTDGNLTDGAGC